MIRDTYILYHVSGVLGSTATYDISRFFFYLGLWI